MLGSLLFFAGVAQDALGQDAAKYTVVFEATWSSLSHPSDFPSNPHFSGLIGGTHDMSVAFWEPGMIASDGIEDMAERGRKGALRDEIEGAIGTGSAEFILSGSGIGTSPNAVSLDFEITSEFPLVTLVSMLAPSPDWFVGVSGLRLWHDGFWVDEVEVPLVVYDAGSDSGPSYASPDDDTVPPEPIRELTEMPFHMTGLVGTYRFTRQQTTARSDDIPQTLSVSAPYPNPAQTSIRLDIEGAHSGPLLLRLFDVTGREVRRKNLIARDQAFRSVEISVAGLPSGAYILEAQTPGEARRLSVVVAR